MTLTPIVLAAITNAVVGAVGGYALAAYVADLRNAVPGLLAALVLTVAAATLAPGLVTLAALGGAASVALGVVCYHYLPAERDSRTRAGGRR